MPANNQAQPVQKDATAPCPHHIAPHLSIDITAYLCPMTFVRTRLALDRLEAGQCLAVRLRGEEPRRSVPRSVIELGHRVISLVDADDGVALLLIEKC